MAETFFRHAVVPVASESDAVATATAIRERVASDSGRVTVLHVIEKAGGAPDKASVEQRELRAERIFERFRDVFADGDVPLETEIAYGTDVARTIVETAEDLDASAIVFTPRGSSKWLKLLTGDVTDKLVAATTVPMVVLPEPDEEGTGGDDGG